MELIPIKKISSCLAYILEMGDVKYLESLPSDKCPDHARLAMVTTKELKTSIRSEKIKLMEQVVTFYSFSVDAYFYLTRIAISNNSNSIFLYITD